MGSGASKAPPISLAVKESRAKAAQLEKELEKLENEKQQLAKDLASRLSDIEKLGEMNRVLERSNEKLKGEIETVKEETANADSTLEELRTSVDQVKKQASKYEAETRDLKGELIVVREEFMDAKAEAERVGQLYTSALVEKETVEKTVKSIEEEKDLLEQMLRAASESMDTYKELSTKLMNKRKLDAEKGIAGKDKVDLEMISFSGDKQEAAKQSKTAEDLLGPLVLKTKGKVKICVVSTFEDFFVERETLSREVFDNAMSWCDERGHTCEVIDLWNGMSAAQESQYSSGFQMAGMYCDEICSCDIVIALVAEKYGRDVGEEVGSSQAAIRPWLATQRKSASRYGSPLELATVYATFYCGKDPSEPTGASPVRSLAYFRDPDYVKGLPEAMTIHFKPEGTRNHSKLVSFKERLKASGIVREELYVNPETLGTLLKDDLFVILGRTIIQPLDGLDINMIMHNTFMEEHAWLGQGAKGRPLPESADAHLERIRKYVVNDVPQPLVIVGEAGSGRTSLMHAAITRLSKRFPAPDTIILSHFCGCCQEASDPLMWIYKVCQSLQKDLKLQLQIPVRPQELETEFPLWLGAASNTGIKIFLMFDGIDRCSSSSNGMNDVIAFLPKVMPSGIRCIVSTTAGPALTSLAQRGCGAITLWSIEEQQKQIILEAYLADYKKSLDKKGSSKLIKSVRTSNPGFLVSTLEEIKAIGVLDGVATQEPMLFYLEADNLGLLTEKSIYRWESSYNGKVLGGSLVRDVLTCIWASRFGLRRAELCKMLALNTAQISPFLTHCSRFVSAYAGFVNLSSQSLSEAVSRRYLSSPDAIAQIHVFLADFFDGPQNLSIVRRVVEVPWQIAKAGDMERLCKCITGAQIFLHLNQENYKKDLWRYVSYLEQNNAHRNLAMYCKTSALAFEQAEPFPGSTEVGNLNHCMGAWLAEIGFLEAGAQLLVKATELWSLCKEGDENRAALTFEALAKVLANLKSPDAEKYFERALQMRTKLATSEGAAPEMALLCNDYGLFQKRVGRHGESVRLFLRSADLWSKIYGADHINVSNAHLNLCTACYAMGNLQQAEDYAQSCLATRKATLGVAHPLYAEALCNLAAVELARGRSGRSRKEAERQLREAITIFESSRGSRHPDTLWARSFISESINDNDDHDEDLDD